MWLAVGFLEGRELGGGLDVGWGRVDAKGRVGVRGWGRVDAKGRVGVRGWGRLMQREGLV